MLFEIYSCPTYYSTNKGNKNNNTLEELGIISLDSMNIYLTRSKISFNPLKIGQELTQWELLPLGMTLIYNTK